MARKTGETLAKPLGYIPYERTKTYADYPESLPRYKWLVEDSLKDASKMFNSFFPHFCKCCGLPKKREEWVAHVREHAEQLKINVAKAAPSPAKPEDAELAADLRAIVSDSIEAKSEATEFKKGVDIAGLLVSGLLGYAAEGQSGEPVFCTDCQD